MVNYLKNETSPYLLQHVDNPVAWYPWGDEPLKKAHEEDKPILLSVGYAACHWCHVMAHESFEDPETADIMNEHYVNIKVDREERPDIDSIYMSAVQAMTGQGGWPMTVIMTPAGKPFFAGTYFPKIPGFGLPSFKQMLMSVAQAWNERRTEIDESAEDITAHIAKNIIISPGEELLDDELLAAADMVISRNFDQANGGFSQAPKFPQAMTIEYLLRRYLSSGQINPLKLAEVSLDRMAYGGIYDHIGGGFARYSTDNQWLVPHFEKMLYDNALLSRVYLHAWQVTGKDLYKQVVEETLDWVLREMQHEDGGFYSSLDADSEGVEGKFYVWTADQVREILGQDSDLFMDYYDIRDGGNWEGSSIPNISMYMDDYLQKLDIEKTTFLNNITSSKQKLLSARNERIRPGLDDKVLTAWNGLMLASFAEAGRILERDDYLKAAVENADFLYRQLRRENGRLWRTWKQGSKGKINAYLEDYSFLADGLLTLYQSTFDKRWYTWAGELISFVEEHFRDSDGGGFFDISDDHESLIYRPKDLQDNATPSGNSMAVSNLLIFGLLSGTTTYLTGAEEELVGLLRPMAEHPTAFAHWLGSAAMLLTDTREVAIIGDLGKEDTQLLLTEVRSRYDPFLVVAVGEAEEDEIIPLLANRTAMNDMASAYVCRRFVCHQPVTTAPALRKQLGS